MKNKVIKENIRKKEEQTKEEKEEKEEKEIYSQTNICVLTHARVATMH